MDRLKLVSKVGEQQVGILQGRLTGDCATEKLSAYARAEYASSTYATTFGTRKVVETTATLQYDLWKNVMTRVEFRWDHAADDSDAYGGTIPGVCTKSNEYLLLASVAYKF